MQKTRILIVDDEAKIVRFISANLKSMGFETESVLDGKSAIEQIDLFNPHLVLLDVMMPEMDGFEVLERIRSFSGVPIVILTARSNSTDKVTGLNLGADDYLTKPFSLEELFARVNAVLRRTERSSIDPLVKSEMINGAVRASLAHRRVWVDEKEVRFTNTEYKLFTMLMQNLDKVIMHEQLLTDIWGGEYKDDVEYIRVAVARIRQKLKQAGLAESVIETFPGMGYMMKSL